MQKPIKYQELKECPYCQGNQLRLLYSSKDLLNQKPGTFYLSRCRNCDLVFQNPRVPEKEIAQYYEGLGYYTATPREKTSNFWQKGKSWLEKVTLINHFGYQNLGRPTFWGRWITFPLQRRLAAQLIPHYVPNGKALDIGPAHGAMMERLENLGWETYGIEMDRQAARYARDERGLDVRTICIEDASFKKGEFDVIIMSMVLEHLYEPFEKLKIITRWLKPGGELLFSIPYFGGLEFKIFRQYAYGLQLPTHITFFTQEILEEFLPQIGYESPEFYYQAVDRDVVASAQYRYQAEGQWFDGLLADGKILRKLLIKPIVHLAGLLGRTSRMSVRTSKQIQSL